MCIRDRVSTQSTWDEGRAGAPAVEDDSSPKSSLLDRDEEPSKLLHEAKPADTVVQDRREPGSPLRLHRAQTSEEGMMRDAIGLQKRTRPQKKHTTSQSVVMDSNKEDVDKPHGEAYKETAVASTSKEPTGGNNRSGFGGKTRGKRVERNLIIRSSGGYLPKNVLLAGSTTSAKAGSPSRSRKPNTHMSESPIKNSVIKSDGVHQSQKNDSTMTNQYTIGSSSTMMKSSSAVSHGRKTLSLYGSTFEPSHEKSNLIPVKERAAKSSWHMSSGADSSGQFSFIREKYSQHVLTPDESAKLIGAKSPRDLYSMYNKDSKNDVMKIKAEIIKASHRAKTASESANQSKLKHWLSKVPWDSSTSVAKIDEENTTQSHVAPPAPVESHKNKHMVASLDLTSMKHAHIINPASQISRDMFKSAVNIYSPTHQWKDGSMDNFTTAHSKIVVKKPRNIKQKLCVKEFWFFFYIFYHILVIRLCRDQMIF
eukprot:TRINITY_DN30947_c0_g1_i1.p1 TRINITY_DN30947_c0_g1~~TRINITY_DN30947_c0_g1_i1.p1  ORF type:complete len:481 (+),score=59.66 TRINITY_DN30947_c0_g1_i1:64-1506(+)